ncbi:MAG: hypothetical protein DSY92_11270 [Planctomycetota bacterium]|nr:MAG: hypothetical protein DSY92_11270 [Planctomycetota bacterium]
MQEAAEKAQDAAEKLSSLAQDSALSRPSSRQQSLADRTSELEDKLDRLEKKLAADQSLSPEEDEKLRKKVGEARQALRSARSAMRGAAEQMSGGESAELAQQAAKDALERAKDALEGSDQDALERLRRQQQKTPELAPEQDELERLTRKRAEESQEEDPEASEGLEGAAQSMDEASDSLERGDSSQAREKQDEALEQLEQEMDSLQQEERELVDLKVEQELIDLIGTITDMAEEVDSILSETRTIAEAIGDGRPGRAQRVRMKRLSSRVADVEDSGNKILAALEAEGVRVFTYIVRDLLSDLAEAREGLSPRSDAGFETQLLLAEALDALRKLRDALEEELRRRNQQQQQPQQPLQQQPQQQQLVPPAAELLALKRMQEEVLRRTRRLDGMRADGGGLDPLEERVLERLVHRQGSIIELTEQIAEDLRRQLQPPMVQEEAPETDSEAKGEPGGSKGDD